MDISSRGRAKARFRVRCFFTASAPSSSETAQTAALATFTPCSSQPSYRDVPDQHRRSSWTALPAPQYPRLFLCEKKQVTARVGIPQRLPAPYPGKRTLSGLLQGMFDSGRKQSACRRPEPEKGHLRESALPAQEIQNALPLQMGSPRTSPPAFLPQAEGTAQNQAPSPLSRRKRSVPRWKWPPP